MNSIEFEWKKLLSIILKMGERNKKDDSVVLEYLGYHTFVTNPLFFQNVLSQKPEDFISYIKNGYFDIKDYPMSGDSIAKYLEELKDPKCIHPKDYEDGFVYTYPERLLAMETYDRISEDRAIIDQFEVIVERLYDEIGSNRAVATLYNCGLDRNAEDIPCLNWLQATIRDNQLVLHVMFRSNDIYGAWPSNMFFLMYIGLTLCHTLPYDVEFKGIDYHVSSAHIYETDLERVKQMG